MVSLRYIYTCYFHHQDKRSSTETLSTVLRENPKSFLSLSFRSFQLPLFERYEFLKTLNAVRKTHQIGAGASEVKTGNWFC